MLTVFLCVSLTLFRMSLVMVVHRMLCSVRLERFKCFNINFRLLNNICMCICLCVNQINENVFCNFTIGL